MKLAMAAPLLLALAGVAGCAGQRVEPQVASSASQTNYALTYPAALQGTANDYVNAEGQVRKNTTDFAKYPDQLKDPPWQVVKATYEAADQAGQSASYVEAHQEVQNIHDFFTDEGGEITRRVAGSAEYVAKKKDCDVDVSGAVAGSLKESVDKQLEKRLRAHSDAYVLIERYRDSLGKPNTAALEKQADDISETSYTAKIETIQLKARASALLDEAGRVKGALDRAIADERAFQAEAGRSPAEKKASNERIAKMEDGKVRIDAAIPQLQALTKEIDQRNDAIKKEYDAAFDALSKAVAAKSSSK